MANAALFLWIGNNTNNKQKQMTLTIIILPFSGFKFNVDFKKMLVNKS